MCKNKKKNTIFLILFAKLPWPGDVAVFWVKAQQDYCLPQASFKDAGSSRKAITIKLVQFVNGW